MSSVHTAHATYELDVSLVSQNQAGNYSTVRVTFYAWCDSGWGSSSSASGIGFSVNTAGNGTFNIGGSSVTIYDGYYNVYHDANGYGGLTASAHSNDTGTSSYGGPVDLSQGISLPRIPKTPGTPGISAGTPVGRNVDVTVSVPAGYDEGGSSVQTLEVVASLNGGSYGSLTTGGWGTRTYTGLAPGSWTFAARAKNAIGYSGYAYSAAVVVHGGGKRWTGSAFTPTTTAKRATSPTTFVNLTTAKRFDGTKWVDLS